MYPNTALNARVGFHQVKIYASHFRRESGLALEAVDHSYSQFLDALDRQQ